MKGKLTISRPQFGDGSKAIQISVKDDMSKVRFLTLSVSLEDFAEALTGLSDVPVSMETRGLGVVGKLRQRENRSVRYEGPPHCRKTQSDWLWKEMQEPGWIVDPYLGSQGSVTYNGDGTCNLNYSVYRYVDAPEESNP